MLSFHHWSNQNRTSGPENANLHLSPFTLFIHITSFTMDSPLQSFKFPRTGKRGVPQQFPRRLYEMLDGETKLMESSELHPKVIHWSVSGRAFRIADTNEFANCVLPKYFRTKKFSSFQRNLNLVSVGLERFGADYPARSRSPVCTSPSEFS